MKVSISFLCLMTLFVSAEKHFVSGENGLDNMSHASCSEDTQGLPQCHLDTATDCDFRAGRTFKHGLHLSIWNTATTTSDLSINNVSGDTVLESGSNPRNAPAENVPHYYFVDTSAGDIPVGSKLHITGEITDSSVEAVCISFRYVMNSWGKPPIIRIKNRKTNYHDGKTTEALIGFIQNNTYGQWMEANINAFVRPQSEIIVEFEKTSNIASVVAITGIKITRSKSVPVCSGVYDKRSGLPTCDFDLWRWNLVSGWHWCDNVYKHVDLLRNLVWKSDGDTAGRKYPFQYRPGNYVYLDVSAPNASIGSKSLLIGEVLSESVTEVCITFNYATTGKTPQTIRIFNNLKKDGVQSMKPLGQVTDATKGEWKEVSFKARIVGPVLSEGVDKSSIIFEGTKRDNDSSIALDDVRVSGMRWVSSSKTDEWHGNTPTAWPGNKPTFGHRNTPNENRDNQLPEPAEVNPTAWGGNTITEWEGNTPTAWPRNVPTAWHGNTPTRNDRMGIPIKVIAPTESDTKPQPTPVPIPNCPCTKDTNAPSTSTTSTTTPSSTTTTTTTVTMVGCTTTTITTIVTTTKTCPSSSSSSPSSSSQSKPSTCN